MTDLNKVILVGRLTKDIGDLRYTHEQMAIGEISIAVNRSKKVNDQWQDEASFFCCTVYGKTAENLKKYLVKGQQVAIEGSLKQERWEKDGQKFSKISIQVSNIQLLGSGKKDNNNEQETGVGTATENQTPSGDFSEDIPF
jgi:single-strand DNA-binding protein